MTRGLHLLKHGMSGTPTYIAWKNMRQRCRDPNHHKYKDYGGRGITVCKRWDEFENFFIDMGFKPDGMSVDRKDVNGNYEPNNCRWATPNQQARNARSNALTLQTVKLIRDMWKHGIPQTHIASFLGLNRSAVVHVLAKRTWSDV